MANIASHLFARARDRADHPALLFGGRAWTFRQLHHAVCQAAAGFAAQGFRAGQKLGLMLPSGAEFLVFEYASFALGGALVPLNVHYTASEIEHVLGACDVDYLLVHADYLPRLTPQVLERLPALRRVWVLGDAPLPAQARFAAAQTLLDHPGEIDAVVERASDDLALMLHTSATTGKAKGVMLTIANLQSNYDRTADWLGLAADERILCALPLYNTFGLNQCINATMVRGATLVLLPRFDPLECLSAIATQRCTFLPAVPTMLQKILNDPRAADFALDSVRRILVGAAPVPVPLLEQVYRQIGRNTVVMTGYGLTEATALVSVEHTALDAQGNLLRPKSVGRVVPGIQMIVADEHGHELPPGQVGQICIRGPNVMRGYYKMPEETAKAIVDGWLQTGDLGTMDPQGHFYIVDRKKDLIIRGGQNIYPADIEDVLYRHPEVAEAAVIGRPDEVFGEVPEAYVALKPGAATGVEELLLLCRAELAYFKVPKQIHLLSELPKGPTGKILRRGLRSAPENQTP